ncbi:MAG: hypothetical protein IKF82_01035 [Bacilli bacterium]|nr:hypothetical protein [Bacilli bacterium]
MENIMENIFDEMNKQLQENVEKDTVKSIIDIYEGYYPDYETYLRHCQRINTYIEQRNYDQLNSGQTRFFYYPKTIILSEKVFDFITELRIMKDSEVKENE